MILHHKALDTGVNSLPALLAACVNQVCKLLVSFDQGEHFVHLTRAREPITEQSTNAHR